MPQILPVEQGPPPKCCATSLSVGKSARIVSSEGLWPKLSAMYSDPKPGKRSLNRMFMRCPASEEDELSSSDVSGPSPPLAAPARLMTASCGSCSAPWVLGKCRGPRCVDDDPAARVPKKSSRQAQMRSRIPIGTRPARDVSDGNKICRRRASKSSAVQHSERYESI